MTTEEICDIYNIRNYTINDDGSIDVNSDVYMKNNDDSLTEIPLDFNYVEGGFYCYDQELTSLKGAPKKTGGNFECGGNKLTSLEYCPTEVGSMFECGENQLTSLKGCPVKVVGAFECDGNQIRDIEGISKEIGRNFICSNNPIGSIFEVVDIAFLDAFRIYKVIKDDQVNLKRLKYVMSMFNRSINLEEIKKHYTIV
jgi:hypothetical protein